MNTDQIKTMLHKAVDQIMDDWTIPEDEELLFFQNEDADTVQFSLNELIDAAIYMAPKKPKSTGRVHWIDEMGIERIEESAPYPTLDELRKYLKGDAEHISVLYKGAKTSMFVNEFGRELWEVRNTTATEVYFAASRARGIDPEDPKQAREDVEAMAKNLGVSPENIHYVENPETAKPPGIYGPAVLLEGFKL